MVAPHILKELAEAGYLLSDVIDSLENFSTQPERITTILETTATLLARIDLSRLEGAGRSRAAAELRGLMGRVQTADMLLESTAALRFGSFLQSGVTSGGYGNNGSVDQLGGCGFHIEA